MDSEAEADLPVEEESQECDKEEDSRDPEPDSQDIEARPGPLVENLSCDRRLDPGEPGYDLDDDGLPGEPLPPLPQEVELYPSQELDPGYHDIQKEKVRVVWAGKRQITV